MTVAPCMTAKFTTPSLICDPLMTALRATAWLASLNVTATDPAVVIVAALWIATLHGEDVAGRYVASPAFVAVIKHVPVPVETVRAPVVALTAQAVDTPAL